VAVRGAEVGVLPGDAEQAGYGLGDARLPGDKLDLLLKLAGEGAQVGNGGGGVAGVGQQHGTVRGGPGTHQGGVAVGLVGVFGDEPILGGLKGISLPHPSGMFSATDTAD